MKHSYRQRDFRNTNKVHIEHGVKIGRNTLIGPYCTIGAYTIIGNNTRLIGHDFLTERMRIENNVFLGPGVIFLNDKYPPSPREDNVVVKDNVIIGGGSVILPKVTINEDVVIGAGSLVIRDCGSGYVYWGRPARRRYTTDIYFRKQLRHAKTSSDPNLLKKLKHTILGTPAYRNLVWRNLPSYNQMLNR